MERGLQRAPRGGSNRKRTATLDDLSRRSHKTTPSLHVRGRIAHLDSGPPPMAITHLDSGLGLDSDHVYHLGRRFALLGHVLRPHGDILELCERHAVAGEQILHRPHDGRDVLSDRPYDHEHGGDQAPDDRNDCPEGEVAAAEILGRQS